MRAFPPAAVSLLALLAAGCGEGERATSDPFTKPVPTVASTYEGLGADAWAARLSDPDPATRADAAVALASLGAAGVARADALAPLLGDASEDVRFAALMAVQRLDDVPEGLATTAVERLSDPSPGVRRMARAAVAAAGAKAVPALRPRLLSKDDATRHEAVGAVVALRASAAAAVPELEAMLRAEDAAAQDDASDGLIAIGAPAVPALRRALLDARDDVAAAAAIALGRVGEAATEAAEDLATAARRGPVRRVAIDALARLGAAGRAVLERLAKDPDDRVRTAAAEALDSSR